MALRSEYALGHSEFNAFLFALVGEESSGQQLTVLSALARLGLDPWGEAARLSGMSRQAATEALAAAIGALPGEDWQVSDRLSIAARLVGCLPRRGAPSAGSPAAGSTQGRSIGDRQQKPGAAKWLVWMAIGAAAFFAVSYLNADNATGPDAGNAISNQQRSADIEPGGTVR
jgi:hypothetical protein